MQKELFQWVPDPEKKIAILTDKGDDLTSEIREEIKRRKRFVISEKDHLLFDETTRSDGSGSTVLVTDNFKKRKFKIVETNKKKKGKDGKEETITTWKIYVIAPEKKKRTISQMTVRSANEFEKTNVIDPLRKELESMGYSEERIKTLINKAFKKTRAELEDCYRDADSCFVDAYVEKKIAGVKKKIADVTGKKG